MHRSIPISLLLATMLAACAQTGQHPAAAVQPTPAPAQARPAPAAAPAAATTSTSVAPTPAPVVQADEPNVVAFATGSDKLDDAASAKITDLVEQARQAKKVEVLGSAQVNGKFNKKLALSRAFAVKRALAHAGVRPGKIMVRYSTIESRDVATITFKP
ncbi:OmpA family protein [Andreprevotia lacus DSM 23236]|jgi:outer membrane protein OmpA-like peptidoglycan-associated protein|uniref:OmpA family protein n=1 Tax=Andreprevotia lacus DSM 23236 TaxID=1121001 RepID=A0A1W1XV49_9NEIS|nr:OmpA family protein [Andreprevotia lacus]SMC27860.1 OmpA family protein [Andreprevotia lacus DSM 23236]